MTNRIAMDKMGNPTKSSENRRATKPIMEKRRRARINQCLGELKTLILDALNKDPSRHSKLEKADILEMTVRHLQNIQRQQMAAAISTDPSVLNKFRAGFSECAGEVSRYVGRIEGVEPGLRQRLLNHLAHCLNTLNAATAPFSGAVAFPGMNPPLLSHLQALNVQIPGNVSNFLQSQGHGDDINNNNTTTSTTPSTRNSSNSSSTPSSKFLGGLPLIPSRLPNGDLALLLPSHALPSGQIPQNLFGLPVVVSPDIKETNGQFNWGPPTPTSPSVSRRSSSPTSSVTSALSPTGSDSSEVEDMEQSHVHNNVRTLDDAVFREPMVHPPPRNCSPVREEPVWRPW